MTQDIWQVAGELLAAALPPRHQSVRLLDVGVSGFIIDGPVQRTLFADATRENQRQLDAVADAVKVTFRSSALSRGSGLLHDMRHRPEPRPDEHSS